MIMDLIAGLQHFLAHFNYKGNAYLTNKPKDSSEHARTFARDLLRSGDPEMKKHAEQILAGCPVEEIFPQYSPDVYGFHHRTNTPENVDTKMIKNIENGMIYN